MARRAAKRYRERGLDKTARRIVAFLEQHGVEGATVLEVGGGVGEVQIEERGLRYVYAHHSLVWQIAGFAR